MQIIIRRILTGTREVYLEKKANRQALFRQLPIYGVLYQKSTENMYMKFSTLINNNM